MICNDIIKILENHSPVKYAEEWDNVGLLVGSKKKTVNKIMIALDPTDTVIEQAIEERVDMLITHHPLLFRPIKKITVDDFIGKRIIQLIQNDISYYAMHTNFDCIGMADAAAEKIDLMNTKVLDTTYTQTLYKIVVYVPSSHADIVRDAMTAAGGGHIGAYSDCTYNIEGMGTFKPLVGTNPYIGTVNEVTKTNETRIETIIEEEKLHSLIKRMITVHPYEEVAYDVYKLENEGKKEGIGRFGIFEEEITLKQCADIVKDRFKLSYIRITGDPNKSIKKAAISTGSGSSMVKYALKEKVDVLITGDIDHHTAIDALQQGLCIIDAGHFGTERFMVEYVKKYLENTFFALKEISNSNTKFPELRGNFPEIILSIENDPFQVQ